MSKANLHTHTLFSDGLLSAEELYKLAKADGIDILSITDHDTIEHIPEEIELAKNEGVDFLIGCEVSAYQNRKDYHILAYNFDSGDENLIKYFEKYKIARLKRAEGITHRFNALKMGLKIDDILKESKNAPIARTHIARAVVNAGLAKDTREVFSKYLYDNGPAYIPKPYTSCKEIIDLIHHSGGVAVLAHPSNFYSIKELENLKKDGIDGIEVIHPLHSIQLQKFFRNFARKYNLIETGGSDFHGSEYDFVNFSSYYTDENTVEKIIEKSKIIRSKSIFKHIWPKLFSFL
ncbi:MAG: PHP domain-containing protein [Candidatus Kapabacteria bacterium]|jgi:predicted metal-dependent phosphoesterase TrpH|nr:PHP domain-containing protein [Candidatus Kapabacteria bacterium]